MSEAISPQPPHTPEALAWLIFERGHAIQEGDSHVALQKQAEILGLLPLDATVDAHHLVRFSRLPDDDDRRRTYGPGDTHEMTRLRYQVMQERNLGEAIMSAGTFRSGDQMAVDLQVRHMETGDFKPGESAEKARQVTDDLEAELRRRQLTAALRRVGQVYIPTEEAQQVTIFTHNDVLLGRKSDALLDALAAARYQTHIGPVFDPLAYHRHRPA